MTPARIKELRDYITGNGTPRDWVPMESKELLELLRMAELSLSLFRTLDHVRNFMPYCLEMAPWHYAETQEAKIMDEILDTFAKETGAEREQPPS